MAKQGASQQSLELRLGLYAATSSSSSSAGKQSISSFISGIGFAGEEKGD